MYPKPKPKHVPKHTRLKFALLGVFVALVVAALIWVVLEPTAKCRLIYDRNVCHFYATVHLAFNGQNYDDMISLCGRMDNVPKKDECFCYVAYTFSKVDPRLAKSACDMVREIPVGGVPARTREECYDAILR